jgi:glutathione synthase/RimK-type ligase-like ATP-grasp enzyme
MKTLGILTLDPEAEHSYYNGIAKEADKYDIKVFQFSPNKVNPIREEFNGYYFNHLTQEWIAGTHPIPEYIYDKTSYTQHPDSLKAKTIVQWLKNKQDITFLGYGLPNKWRIHETLQAYPSINQYLPPTELVENEKDVLSFLKSEKEIILKPIDGAGGYAIYHISTSKDRIIVKTTKANGKMVDSLIQPSSFLRLIRRLMKHHTFMMQPRLNNLSNENQPFDLRILLQKNMEGNWKITGKGIRVGAKNGILTNISAGARFEHYHEWKEKNKQFDWELIEDQLTTILQTFPLLLESSFAPLFELGLDILIEPDHSLWILDTNSKPGHKLITSLYPDRDTALFHAPLKYLSSMESMFEHPFSRGEIK